MKRNRKEEPFFEQLKAIPNISIACEKVGLSRNTIYRWCHEDPEFKKRLDDALRTGVDSINDLAESKLINHINQGNLQAIRYWLDNNKKNYARPRPKDFWDSIALANEDRVTQIIITTAKNNPPNEEDPISSSE
jgi:hypothetical protein